LIGYSDNSDSDSSWISRVCVLLSPRSIM
jgi:hypothetical protein